MKKTAPLWLQHHILETWTTIGFLASLVKP